MPLVHYEYEKSKIVEDSVEVPADVIARGDKAIRNYLMETVWNEDYDRACESENEEVTFKVDEAA